MKGRLRSLAGVAFAALALSALAATGAARGEPRDRYDHGPARDGGRGVGRFQPPRAYGPGPVRGRAGLYGPPPAAYSPPPPPYYPAARPNSLGAQWGQQQDEARSGVRQGRIMPLARVVQNLQKLRPGRVLDAGIEQGVNGRATYRVRWAAVGGRRMDFIIDAETGAVIGRGAE
jgi:hypothetical protein